MHLLSHAQFNTLIESKTEASKLLQSLSVNPVQSQAVVKSLTWASPYEKESFLLGATSFELEKPTKGQMNK